MNLSSPYRPVPGRPGVRSLHRLAAFGVSAALLLAAACTAAPAAPTAAPTATAKLTTAPAAPTAPAAAASPAVAASPAAVASPAAASSPAVPVSSPAAAPASPVAAASPAIVPLNTGPITPLFQPASGPHTSLKVSYSNVIADNMPEWVAKESGIFAMNGLDVDLQNIASTGGIPALSSGEIQIAHLGGSETISADAGGLDLVILGNQSSTYPFVMMVAKDIQTKDDLKGKTIGVSSPGSSSDIATRVLLQYEGLDPDKDVHIQAVGSLQNRMAALASGAIQAGVAQPPDQIELEKQGFHVLWDEAALGLPSSGNCIVAQRSWVNSNHDVMQKYIDSIVEAVKLAKSNKAFALQVLSKYLNNTDEQAINVTYDFYVGEVTKSVPSSQPAQFADAIAQLGKSNDAVKNFDVSKIIDNSFVDNAVSRGLNAPQ